MLANLLVNRCSVTSAAAAATLLDLAARRWLLLFEAGPGQYVVRIQPPRDEPLTEYEHQVLALVRKNATGGSAPLEAIELEQSEAERWRSDFADKVMDDAKERGLVRRRWNAHDGVVLGAVTAVALALIAAGLYFAARRVEPAGRQRLRPRRLVRCRRAGLVRAHDGQCVTPSGALLRVR